MYALQNFVKGRLSLVVQGSCLLEFLGKAFPLVRIIQRKWGIIGDQAWDRLDTRLDDILAMPQVIANHHALAKMATQ